MPGQAALQRRCLPLADWPQADRQAWEAAVAPGDLLLDDGPGARLAPRTLLRHRASYGRLSWLLERGRLDPATMPGKRATRVNIGDYITALQAQNVSGTVLVRLQSLAVVLSWLAPEQDWAWLQPYLSRLAARAKPVRDKGARLQSAGTLFTLGERLMAEAEAKQATAGNERAQAQLYRDGLMIAFLSCHPLRAGNFASLELGQQLRPMDSGWWLEIPADETKTRQPIAMALQHRLVLLLERYLAVWRPHLASRDRVARSRAIWLTREGTAISPTHLHGRITRHTAAAFALPVSPHGFRDAVATTIALTAPGQIGIVTPLLGHRSFITAQRHYNLAGMASAATAWHEVLRQIERGLPRR